ncbi:MAG: hypothetical protein AAGB04_19530 [Pseudomonadota bacterium]
MLGKAPEDISKTERNAIGKVSELAFGYGGGVGALQTMMPPTMKMVDYWDIVQTLEGGVYEEALEAWDVWGCERNAGAVDYDEWIACEMVKRAWRNKHPAIVVLWKACEEAAKSAVDKPLTTFMAGEHLAFKALSFKGHNYLLMRMPSGGFLVYFNPRLEDDGSLTYMGVDPITKQWVRQGTYGGKLVENSCQSLSRDILAYNMHRMGPEGYALVLTVHDEVITETPDTNEYSHESLSAILATNPPYAKGFPLAAGGFEAYRYRKDD